MEELVSIITPLYNAERYIGEAIESVLSQTYSNWEMLVVDDASTDGSAGIAEAYSVRDGRIRLLGLERNSGPAVARNLGIGAAKGRFIAFLDSDDVWFPSLLEREIEVLVRTGAGVVFASYERFDERRGRNISPFIVPESVTHADLLKTCSISCLTGIYDTAKTGKLFLPEFDEREDYGIWLEALKKVPCAIGIPEPLARYRIRERSVSRNKVRIAFRQWRFYREVAGISLPQSFYYLIWWAYYGFRKYRS